MAGVPSEFDDVFDEDERGRLLPPEDRVWRHPSELNVQSDPIAAEAMAARERWMSSTPSRAGAWSAGLVGAMLATGVVLVGMHLTSWLGDSHPTYRVAGRILMTTTTVSQASELSTVVASGLTFVAVSRTENAKAYGAGVIIGNVGDPARTMVLVPASLVTGATSIEVTSYDRQVFAGQFVGADPGTGLAVVSIFDSDALHRLPYSSNATLQPGEWVKAEWATPTGDPLVLGGVKSIGQAPSASGASELLLSVVLQMPSITAVPAGTVFVNAEGQLLGVVTGRKGDRVTDVPARLAELIGMDIAQNGHFVHGWLGISAKSYSASLSHPSGPDPSVVTEGVRVVSVPRDSSAAVAGLKPGDVIEAVNGHPVYSMRDLASELYVLPPRSDVALTIDRGATVRTLQAMLQPAA